MTQNPEDESGIEEKVGEEADKGVGLLVTRPMRIWGAVLFGLVLFFALSLIATYLLFAKPHMEPAKLDLTSLVIFCAVGLVVFLLPWEDYQINVKKLGPFEFTRMLSVQAKERESELRDVWKAIEKLKTTSGTGAMNGEKEAAPSGGDEAKQKKLETLLTQFLAQHPTTAFNATRIKNKESTQFDDYGVPDIQRALRKMVAMERVDTRMSRKTGSTLYITRK
ncbi:MAG TPA: hypothetical protein VFD26_05115 [Methyloceanibacter sp.]|nr:hypothetical protein [Methyloceanibacter sp.]